MSKFNIKINGGPERYHLVKTGIYRDAAAAVPAIYDTRLPCEVEIWSEHDGEELGRFRYRIRENEFGQFMVEHLVRQSQQKPE